MFDVAAKAKVVVRILNENFGPLCVCGMAFWLDFALEARIDAYEAWQSRRHDRPAGPRVIGLISKAGSSR